MYVDKPIELLETLTTLCEDNQQPSLRQRKVQRLAERRTLKRVEVVGILTCNDEDNDIVWSLWKHKAAVGGERSSELS